MAAGISPADERGSASGWLQAGRHLKDVHTEHGITSEQKGISGAYQPSITSQKLMKTLQSEGLFPTE